MKCLPLDLGLDFQAEQQHHFEESADENVASKCPGNNCEHQLEDIKTPPGIVTKKSKISGGGISRGLGVWKDMMYEGYPAHYFSSGYSALFCVRRALDKAAGKVPDSILDFGCGHGRVLRSLAADFPHAGLTAADVDSGGVNFCVKTFGAVPVYSNTDFSRLVFNTKFDLIWVGSVFTHLRSERWMSLLEVFRSILTEDGLLVFSTHGSDAERRLREGQCQWCGLEADRVARILRDYDERGFGYSDYRKSHDYGFSLSSPEWVSPQIAEVGLELVLYQNNGWDDCQDVWASRLARV
jgi:SAM-dependent methyltransferase